jgi:uncharacterized protein (TIGR02453 family)
MIQQASLQFLDDLRENNHKDWFTENRKRYDHMKADYIGLADRILTELKKHDPGLETLTAKDCIFRVNKDVRFSKDKSPYKTHLGIALHPMGKKMMTAAYYLHIERGQSFIGGGLWQPDAPLLNKVRKEINYFYNDLRQILDEKSFKSNYRDLSIEQGNKLSRPPKGYEADNPAIEYLKLKSFTVGKPIPDKALTDPKLFNQVIKDFRSIQPLLGFINRGLMSDDEGGI